MKQHCTEVDLLELYYLPDGPVAKDGHVGGCSECQARFERLSAKLRNAADQHAGAVDRLPETFWVRQRVAIDRAVQKQHQAHSPWALRTAAALLIALLGVVLLVSRDRIQRNPERIATETAVTPAQTPIDTAPLTVIGSTDDPWQSDALSSYQSVIDWEEWVDEGKSGGTS
jgi:hypothetical protein